MLERFLSAFVSLGMNSKWMHLCEWLSRVFLWGLRLSDFWSRWIKPEFIFCIGGWHCPELNRHGERCLKNPLGQSDCPRLPFIRNQNKFPLLSCWRSFLSPHNLYFPLRMLLIILVCFPELSKAKCRLPVGAPRLLALWFIIGDVVCFEL